MFASGGAGIGDQRALGPMDHLSIAVTIDDQAFVAMSSPRQSVLPVSLNQCSISALNSDTSAG